MRAKKEDALNSYCTFTPNARVLFPYKRNSIGKLDLIPLELIEERFPLFYTYLMDVKSELAKPSRDIQPAPVTANEWYRYGRHQSLDACERKEKL